jgi:putative endonuclease
VAAWSLYLIRTRQGALYAGVATDVARRVKEHAGNGGRGSKYLRSRGPLELVYSVEIGDRAQALRAEARIKGLAKVEKERIVAAAPGAAALLARLFPDGPEKGEPRTSSRRRTPCP